MIDMVQGPDGVWRIAPAPKPAGWSLPQPTGQVLDRRV